MCKRHTGFLYVFKLKSDDKKNKTEYYLNDLISVQAHIYTKVILCCLPFTVEGVSVSVAIRLCVCLSSTLNLDLTDKRHIKFSELV